jgi:hypothetical protein
MTAGPEPEPAPEPGLGPVLPCDYDTDPGRFAAGQAAAQRFSARGDLHSAVARRLIAEAGPAEGSPTAGGRRIADIGGGNGTLARLLAGHSITVVTVDRAGYITRGPVQRSARTPRRCPPLGPPAEFRR